MKVKNVECPTGLQHNGEWWLLHWTKISQRNAKVCAVKSCIHTSLVGALVEKEGADGEAVYVVPLCKHHSETKESFELIIGTRLVLVEADLMV